MPTLLTGDFIAVNKHAYGIRNPLTNNVIIETGMPKRGDVIVFKYPEDKSIDYIIITCEVEHLYGVLHFFCCSEGTLSVLLDKAPVMMRTVPKERTL